MDIAYTSMACLDKLQISLPFLLPSLHFIITQGYTNFERWSPGGQNFVRWAAIVVGPHYETRFMSHL